MEHNWAPLLAILGVIIGTVVVVLALLNHSIKMRMIKEGHVDENSIKILGKQSTEIKLDTLKWGIILLFGGAGMIVLNYVRYEYDSTMPFGIEMVSLALGFLTYYFVAQKQKSH